MPQRTLPALHPAGVALGVVLCAAGVLLVERFVGPLLLRSTESPEEQTLTAVHRLLAREYVEPRDPEWESWLLRRAVQGMVEGLDDPYTYFIDGPQGLEELAEESTGRLEGIGVILDSASATVRWPQPGGPAEQAGIRPGDLILAVDGKAAAEFTPEDLRQAIKGAPGTRVLLEIQRPAAEPVPAERLPVEVVRGSVPTGTVNKVEMLDRPLGIGSLHISSFASSTPAELDAALSTLQEQGLRALVLDLRYNAGGLLPAAVQVAARFLHGGLVCTLYSRSHPTDARNADPSQSKAADLPLVVLMNGHSASGSEVLAGALRDHGAAVLAGERSYGKGVFQQVYPFRDEGFAFKFTAGYYVTPGGRVLEGHIDPDRSGGLEPDLPVPASEEQSASLYRWLRSEEPPPQYRAEVLRLFPDAAPARPADPVLDAALAQLTRVLQAS